jgi:hypothetical protein
MRLYDITSAQELNDALRRGDEELMRDIDAAVDAAVLQARDNTIREFYAAEELPTNWIEPITEVVLGGWGNAAFAARMVNINDVIRDNLYSYLTGQVRAIMGFEHASGPGEDVVVLIPPIPDVQELEIVIYEPLAWLGRPQLTDMIVDRGVEDLRSRGAQSGSELRWTGTYVPAEGDEMEQAAYVKMNITKLREAVMDAVGVDIEEAMERDPTLAIEEFYRQLQERDPELYRKIKKEKLPTDVLISFAKQLFQDPTYGLQILREATGDWGYEGSKAELLLEVSKDDLRALGFDEARKGSRYIQQAPWALVSLPPPELAFEGTWLRHCVGNPSFGYRDKVANSEMMIWSLRRRAVGDSGRVFYLPYSTWEVDAGEWENARSPQARGRAIKQLKHKTNILGPTTEEEDQFYRLIFDRLDIDPASVRDYSPSNIGKPPSRRVYNPGALADDRTHPQLMVGYVSNNRRGTRSDLQTYVVSVYDWRPADGGQLWPEDITVRARSPQEALKKAGKKAVAMADMSGEYESGYELHLEVRDEAGRLLDNAVVTV